MADWHCCFLLPSGKGNLIHLVIFWMACKSFWVCFFAVRSHWAASQANGNPQWGEQQKSQLQNNNFLLLHSLKSTFDYLHSLNHWWWSLSQLRSQSMMCTKGEKNKGLWRSNRCPLGLLPRYRQLYHRSKIPWPLLGWESHIPKDKETEIVWKSNWREEQTKIRTIDIDPGKKIHHVLSARMLMQRWRYWGKRCVFLASDTHSLLTCLFSIPSL